MSFKTIVIAGTGYSGSTAIYEYLQLQKNFHDPFKNKEFTISYDPCGIRDIENCIIGEYSISKANFVYRNFLENINFYINKENDLKPGKNFQSPEKVKKLLLKYSEEIVDFSYEGNTSYLKYKKSKFETIKQKLFNISNDKIVFFKDIKIFNDVTKKLFIDLFNYENKDIILDQGANIYNLYDSSKYYPNPICILVFRDPRDIFSEFKFKSAYSYPKSDVETFCDWYQNSMNKIENQNFQDLSILKIQFEDFINNHNESLEKISEFLSIHIKPNNEKFDFIRSKKNILKYEKLLTNEETSIIKKKLSKYLLK